MKVYEWTDDKGYKRKRLVKDGDSFEQAQFGVPQEPPDVEQIDWEGVKRNLHNLLTIRGIISWEQVSRSDSQLASVLIQTLKPHVLQLFKEDRNGSV